MCCQRSAKGISSSLPTGAQMNMSTAGSHQSHQTAQIAQLRLEGMTYRQIGATLNISREWVRVRLKKVNLAGRCSLGYPTDEQLRDLVELCGCSPSTQTN